jgi:hypothetical protein
MSETGKLASERVDASKKIREATEKRQNNKKGSKTVIKTEKNNKSRSKKNSKSENKK